MAFMQDNIEAITLPPNRMNLSGQRYGRLVCLWPTEVTKKGKVAYLCRCDCGMNKIINSSNLRSGHTQSCGCLLGSVVGVANRTHGKSRSPIYRVWTQMMQRCYKPYAPNYKWYGGRGVTVASEWHSFECFYADMGDAPEGLTLDREDNDGPYSKKNCRWASRKAQTENTRAAIHIQRNGVTKTLSSWDRELGRGKDFLGKRLRRGLSVEEAFENEKGN